MVPSSGSFLGELRPSLSARRNKSLRDSKFPLTVAPAGKRPLYEKVLHPWGSPESRARQWRGRSIVQKMHSVISCKTFLLQFLARSLNIALFFGQGRPNG